MRLGGKSGLIKKIKNLYSEIGCDGLVLILCAVSMFFTFYLCTAVQLAALIYAIRKYSSRKIYNAPHNIFLFVLAIPAVCTGIYFKNYLGLLILLGFYLLYIFSIYENLMMTPRIRDILIDVVALSSIVSFFAAAIQKYPNPSFRSISFFVNANFYGYVCEITIVIMIYALYSLKSKRLYAGAICACILGIALSGCRSAWFAAFAGMVIVMLCLKKYRHLTVSIITCAAAAVLVLTVPRFIFPRYSAFKSDKSLRFLIWKTAAGYIREHPVFGHGMFAYYAISTGRAHDAHAHDLILDLLVDFGIVGTLLVAVFMFFVIRAFIKNLKSNGSCAAALGIFAAAFVHGVTDIPYIGIQPASITMLALAFGGMYGVYSTPGGHNIMIDKPNEIKTLINRCLINKH